LTLFSPRRRVLVRNLYEIQLDCWRIDPEFTRLTDKGGHG
jgi:hypothetical protein